jgi:hypothetical protein
MFGNAEKESLCHANFFYFNLKLSLAVSYEISSYPKNRSLAPLCLTSRAKMTGVK